MRRATRDRRPTPVTILGPLVTTAKRSWAWPLHYYSCWPPGYCWPSTWCPPRPVTGRCARPARYRWPCTYGPAASWPAVRPPTGPLAAEWCSRLPYSRRLRSRQPPCRPQMPLLPRPPVSRRSPPAARRPIRPEPGIRRDPSVLEPGRSNIKIILFI